MTTQPAINLDALKAMTSEQIKALLMEAAKVQTEVSEKEKAEARERIKVATFAPVAIVPEVAVNEQGQQNGLELADGTLNLRDLAFFVLSRLDGTEYNEIVFKAVTKIDAEDHEYSDIEMDLGKAGSARVRGPKSISEYRSNSNPEITPEKVTLTIGTTDYTLPGVPKSQKVNLVKMVEAHASPEELAAIKAEVAAESDGNVLYRMRWGVVARSFARGEWTEYMLRGES